MSELIKLFAKIIAICWFLAEVGLLKEANLFMGKLAVSAHKQGYMSLRKFNLKLMGHGQSVERGSEIMRY